MHRPNVGEVCFTIMDHWEKLFVIQVTIEGVKKATTTAEGGPLYIVVEEDTAYGGALDVCYFEDLTEDALFKTKEDALREIARQKAQITVYLAGKITGDPYYRSKFHDAAVKLEAAGFSVVNPATLPERGFDYGAYLRMSSAMLDECVAACFLSDWKDSTGAMYEYGRAMARDMEVFFFDEWMASHEVLSVEKTGQVAFRCFSCDKISVYPDKSGDGQRCANCGGHILPIGYAKAEVKIGAQ